MAASSYPLCMPRLMVYEGGFANDPQDPGGRTLNGITQAVYNVYRDRKGLPRKLLTPAMAHDPSWITERDTIYKTQYWDSQRCDELPAGVDAALFDYGVNSGTGRSRKVLQREVGATPDGAIGPKTMAAVAATDPATLINRICDERLHFMKSLYIWPRFGAGWSTRVRDLRAFALHLVVGKHLPMTLKHEDFV